MPVSLELDVLGVELAVARLEPAVPLPDWASEPAELTAVVRTPDELSVIVPMAQVPGGTTIEGPWLALKVRGPLSFELTGILAALASTLADAEISIFAISTFDTDYVLVRSSMLARAVAALEAAGHHVRHRED